MTISLTPVMFQRYWVDQELLMMVESSPWRSRFQRGTSSLSFNVDGFLSTSYMFSLHSSRTDMLFFSLRYPFEPPKIRFLTPIYHPNIDNSGRICHDALKLPPKVIRDFQYIINSLFQHHYMVDTRIYVAFYTFQMQCCLYIYFFFFFQGAWKPSLNISTVLTSIQLLMAEPNPDDPLMADIVSHTQCVVHPVRPAIYHAQSVCGGLFYFQKIVSYLYYHVTVALYFKKTKKKQF